MKIGYVMQAGAPRMVTHPNSGPAVHVREVCQGLQQLGHEVSIVARWNDQLFFSDNLQTFSLVNPGQPSRFAMSRFAPFDSMRFARDATPLLRDCDVLYERAGWFGLGGAMLSRHLQRPLVVEVNGDHLWEHGVYHQKTGLLTRLAYKTFTGAALRRARKIITTGSGWRTVLLDRFHLLPSQVQVVHCGTRVVELLERSQLRTFGPPTQNDPVAMTYLGGFYPWHGLGRLLRVVKRLSVEALDFRLSMIGAGPGERNTRELAKKLRLDEKVTFFGHLPSIEYAPVLARSEIGLATYCGTAEFTGLKLMDYKAAGLATIASGEDGQPDVIEHGVTGLIVKPCDDEQLYTALVKLVCDARLRRALGQQARIDAEQKHSWWHTVTAIDAILCNVRSASEKEHDGNRSHTATPGAS